MLIARSQQLSVAGDLAGTAGDELGRDDDGLHR